jgi:MFS family permease
MDAVTKKVWLNPTVVGIGFASLCSDTGHEMATTAMPALIAMVGGSAATLGLIEGLADGISSFAKLYSGIYSDRMQQRKPLAIFGYLATAIGMASFGWATKWWHVLIGRVGGWIGRGIRNPICNVLLTEAVTPETYGRAFGLERAMDSAGAVLGPLLSFVLVATIGLKKTFLFSFIPCCMAAVLIFFLVKEKPHVPHAHHTILNGIKDLPQTFRRYLLGVGIAGIGDFSNTLLILWATQSFGQRFGMAKGALIAMLFYVGYNIVYTISCYISGNLADAFPKNRVLAIGYSLAIIPAAALMFPGASFIKFAIVFGFSGLYMGVWETLENTTAATMLPSHIRGMGFGILATVNGIGDLISSIIVGFLWMGSPMMAMSFVIITSLIGAGIILSTSK